MPVGYTWRMPEQAEAATLVNVSSGVGERTISLAPAAAVAWEALYAAATVAGLRLVLISGFRSVERQRQIVLRKWQAGQTLEQILQVNAYPGHSEHHTGRAIDLGVTDGVELTEAFASTDEFAWLEANAGRFGFVLSYPRGNFQGVAYEPWHWFFRGAE